MTTYDPETGLRIEAARGGGTAGSAPAGPRWQPNPFLLALTATWLLAGSSGLLAWPVGATAVASGTGGLPVLVLSAVCVLTAVAAGVAHLAVLALGWRPPEA